MRARDLQAALELVSSRYRCARVPCEGSRARGAQHTGCFFCGGAGAFGLATRPGDAPPLAGRAWHWVCRRLEQASDFLNPSGPVSGRPLVADPVPEPAIAEAEEAPDQLTRRRRQAG